MKRLFVLAMAALVFTGCGNQSGSAPVTTNTVNPVDAGQQLFQQNCASCHTIKIDLVGPALAGVSERWPDKQQLYAFIKNAPEVVKQNKYAESLWKKYNQSMMTPFPNLTDKEIDAILLYIDAQTKSAVK